MAEQIKKKFIADAAVDGDKIKLLDSQAIKMEVSGVTYDLIKLDGDGKVQLKSGEAAVKADVTSLQGQIDNILSNTDPAALDSLTEIVDAFQAADNNLNNAITDLASNIKGDLTDATHTTIEGLDDGLAQEITDRQAADLVLQSGIDSEVSLRESEITRVEGLISDMDAAYKAADQNLADQISGLQGADDVLFEDDSTVYADATAPIEDPTGRDGWYYKSAGSPDKINWYFHDGQANPVTVGQWDRLYTVATVDSSSNDTFHLAYYTFPLGDGQDAGSWYRSRIVYVPSGNFERGVKTLFYMGQEPDASVYPDLPRVQMIESTVAGSSVGLNEDSEVILTAVLGTNSAALADTVEILVNKLGFNSSVYNKEYSLEVRGEFTLAGVKQSLLEEAITRQKADSVLQDNIDAEEAARIAADDALSARVDVLEALEPEEVFTYSSLAQFPSTGESSKVYIAQDSDKIYHWKAVQQPESFDHTVGASGDFPDLATALADASVLDGHKIKVLNGTYDLAAQLVISKQVQIFGESKAGVILQSSADGSAPVSLISVSASNVAMVDMTIKHRKTTNTTLENAMAISGDNFIMSNVQLEYMEFGVVFSAADSWLVKDCDFVYTGVAGNDNRPVGIYGMSGNCFVDGCQFDDNGTAANVKPIFMASQDVSGTLVIDGNSSVNDVHQFVVVENLTGTPDSFDLVVKNNTTNETSAYILIAGDSNDVINSITASGNSLSHSHTSTGGGKGIVTFYGTGDWGKIDLHQENNTLQDEFFRSGYTLFSQLKDSLGNPITTGFSAGTSDSFEPTIDVTLDDVIAANPSQSSVPSLGGGSVEQYAELSEQIDLSGLEADLAAEEAARIAADSNLQSQIDFIVSNTDPAALDSLTEIVSAFQDADGDLDQAITDLGSNIKGDLTDATYTTIEQLDDAIAAITGSVGDSWDTPIPDGTEILPATAITNPLDAAAVNIGSQSNPIGQMFTGDYYLTQQGSTPGRLTRLENSGGYSSADAVALFSNNRKNVALKAITNNTTGGSIWMEADRDVSVSAKINVAINAVGTTVLAGQTNLELRSLFGSILVDADSLDMGNNKIENLASPSASGDATNKLYVDSAIGTSEIEKFTLSAADVSNGYIDLAEEVDSSKHKRMQLFVGRLAMHLDDDFTLSSFGGVTRVTFAGSMASGGAEALAEGDVLYVRYVY